MQNTGNFLGREVGLAFLGGLAGLVLQSGWFHTLRFVLGTSTAAMAVGTAIFMGGLGLGSLLMGPWLERQARPWRRYAQLEAGIALLGTLSPFLLGLAKGLTAAPLRVGLAILAVGLPAALMGGTLPALGRAALPPGAAPRHPFAWLYGMNTLGAAIGAGLGCFFLLPRLGASLTLWTAALLDAGLASLAWNWDRARGPALSPSDETAGAEDGSRALEAGEPAGAVRGAALTAAFLTGAGFFLIEVVWYRLLGPLLGGTVQAFGALLGGLLLGLAGGALFLPWVRLPTTGPDRRFTVGAMATALAIAAPFALGDRVALWVAVALSDSPGGGWLPPGAPVAFGAVVLPVALLAGWLTPLLVLQAGQGRPGVARHVGWLLGANTLGGLVGAVAGGLWLLPGLGVNGCWLLSTGLFVTAGVVALEEGAISSRILWSGLGIACLLPFLATGPTAFWRHCHAPQTAQMIQGKSPAQTRDIMSAARRRVIWEREGVETALAISNAGGLTLLTNGNGEGNVTQDQAMLISLGLVGAARHPAPRDALVIGQGTGCTAGWLAEIPGLERVDVFELEPLLMEMASRCAVLNHDVLRNPRVHLQFGDGRQLLQAANETWDLIVNGPSNLFRAGMAGLYSQDFFRVVAGRLRPGGLFGLWVQVYEIDGEALQIVIRTLQSVFPHVEGWEPLSPRSRRWPWPR